jgi:uncharacterized protein (DUF2236 family)
MSETADMPLLARAWGAWPYIVPMTGRIFALQAMHPTVAAGIRDHSKVLEDPWDRLIKTYGYALEVVFGDTIGKAREIRALHRNITGHGYDGRRYHAWDPAAWTWVHLTTLDAMLYALRAIDGPIDLAEQHQLYEEWKAIGRIYGVRDENVPPDIFGFRRYINEGIHDLVVTPTAQRLIELAFEHLPPASGVPRPLWRAGHPALRHTAFVLLAGAFPPTIRQRLAIRWTRRHAVEYRAALLALRSLAHALPDKLRLFPIAYQRLHS